MAAHANASRITTVLTTKFAPLVVATASLLGLTAKVAEIIMSAPLDAASMCFSWATSAERQGIVDMCVESQGCGSFAHVAPSVGTAVPIAWCVDLRG